MRSIARKDAGVNARAADDPNPTSDAHSARGVPAWLGITEDQDHIYIDPDTRIGQCVL